MMEIKVEQSVFWPGKAQEIRDTRERYGECSYQAPSQPVMPLYKPVLPDILYSHLCEEFFSVDLSYLALCDQYSRWYPYKSLKR